MNPDDQLNDPTTLEAIAQLESLMAKNTNNNIYFQRALDILRGQYLVKATELEDTYKQQIIDLTVEKDGFKEIADTVPGLRERIVVLCQAMQDANVPIPE